MLHRVSCVLLLSGVPFLTAKAETRPAQRADVVRCGSNGTFLMTGEACGSKAGYEKLVANHCGSIPNWGPVVTFVFDEVDTPNYQYEKVQCNRPSGGTLDIYYYSRWIGEGPAFCPNASWTLSTDGLSCSRPDPEQCVETAMLAPWAKAAPSKPCPPPCKPDINAVTQEKLLAAIVYGESSVQQVKEEMYGIASAMVRKRDAWQQGGSLQKFLKKYPRYAYAVTDGNVRYKELMCASDAKKYTQAYEAARNALAYGVDYSNGGCFWDGVDLKVKGSRHPTYEDGFRFTSLSHNIFNIAEPSPKNKKAEFGVYSYIYDSTAAYGGTVFWRVNEDYLKARKAKQCN